MLLYALVKFAAYVLWCWLGAYLLAVRPSFVDALKFGGVRWLIGLAFGVAAAIGLGSISQQSSFASDLASPEGMAGRFCVGRCLC